MSLSGALSNALSGLTATSRSAQIVSSNISNAMTEGYGVREAQMVSRSVGDEGGVQFIGVQRNTNEVVIAGRREAESDFEASKLRNDSLIRIQNQFGLPGDDGSLQVRLSTFQSALIEAQANSDSDVSLNKVVDTAKSLAHKLNGIGSQIQAERTYLDTKIANSVNDLNGYLEKISNINVDIKKRQVLDHDTSALLDQRQVLVDQVNALVPVRQLSQGDGAISLVTESGHFLVDSSAAKIEFDRVNLITEYSTVSNGALTVPTVNDLEIFDTSSVPSTNGGAIGAMLAMRDVELVQLQASTDAMARELIDRLSDPAVVGTASASDPGFFTDNGSAFDPLNEVGLAQRIEVNALVDEESGGEVWRVRDGLAQGSPYDVGASKFLTSIGDALVSLEPVKSSSVTPVSGSIEGIFSQLTSQLSFSLSESEQELSYQSAKLASATDLENSLGVDSDHEMQRLLLIEQSYAANARVVQVVGEMLDWLMRI